MLAVTLSLVLLSPAPAQAGQPSAPTELYGFVLVQAAPGRLLELISIRAAFR